MARALLVEMLVVLALLAVTAAVALPYSRESDRKAQLRASAQQIAAVLQRQKFLAVSNNAPDELIFDSALRQFMNKAGKSVYSLPADISATVKTARLTSDSDIAKIRFFADGGSTGGTVSLISGKESVVIKLSWLSGTTTIETGIVQ